MLIFDVSTFQINQEILEFYKNWNWLVTVLSKDIEQHMKLY